MRADFCLGNWIVRPRRGCIERGEEVVHIHPKPMAVLECLAGANGEVVTRDELHDQVWPSVIVTDDTLTQCIAELRKAFGDTAKESRIIKTIPKTGFCLVPPVKPRVDRQNDQAPRGKKWLLSLGAIIVVVAVLLIWRATETSDAESPATAPQRPSIAVLPFANRSSNPDDAFFVDGIHDDLLTHISKISGIKTISRTSVMRYRGSTKSIPEIAGELGVSAILEGGVQRDGNSIRINIQLIDTESDTHLWSEIYQRELSAGSIFAIQNEIAGAISVALEAILTPMELKRLSFIPTQSLEAYESFLLGRRHMAKRVEDSLVTAIKYFSTAIEIDSQYALAWASLGEAYLLQGEGSDRYEFQEKAKAAAEMALTIDPGLGEVYATLAMLEWNLGDEAGAEKFFLKSIELAPNYATNYHWYSILLRAQGRLDEALEMISAAVQLDPMSPAIRQFLAVVYRSEGRHEEALEELELAITIDPNFAHAYDAIATIEYQVFNRMARAARAFVKNIELNPASPGGYAFLGQLYLELGEPGRSRILFDESHKLDPVSSSASWGQLLLQVYQADLDAINASAEIILSVHHKSRWEAQFTVAQLRNQAIINEQIAQAKMVYSQRYPELLEDAEVVIGLHNYRAAIDLSLVLQKSGEEKSANELLDKCQDFISERPRLGWWGGFWVSDVQILALQGRKAEALTALQRAVDEGWRSLWWYYLKYDPNLESIRSEPAFQAVLAEIKADMANQMQRIRDMEQSGEIEAVDSIVFESE